MNGREVQNSSKGGCRARQRFCWCCPARRRVRGEGLQGQGGVLFCRHIDPLLTDRLVLSE